MVSYLFHLLILHPYSLALMYIYHMALQLYPLLNKKDMFLPMFVYGCLHMKAAAASIPSSERGLSAFSLYYLLRARARRPKQVVLLAVR